MGVFFAIAQKNEDKEKARKMIKNYVIGLVRILLKLYTKTKLMIIALRFALCHTGEHKEPEKVISVKKIVLQLLYNKGSRFQMRATAFIFLYYL